MNLLLEIALVVGSFLAVLVVGWRVALWWWGRNPCACGHGASGHPHASAYCIVDVRHRNAAGRPDWRRCECRGYRKPGESEALTIAQQLEAERAARRIDPLDGLCGITGHPVEPHACQQRQQEIERLREMNARWW